VLAAVDHSRLLLLLLMMMMLVHWLYRRPAERIAVSATDALHSVNRPPTLHLMTPAMSRWRHRYVIVTDAVQLLTDCRQAVDVRRRCVSV